MRCDWRVVLGVVSLLALNATAFAEEPVPTQQDSKDDPPMALVAVPSFQGTLPDGTPVIGIIVVPAENVLNRNDAWQTFSQTWPTRYRFQKDEVGAVSAMPSAEGE